MVVFLVNKEKRRVTDSTVQTGDSSICRTGISYLFSRALLLRASTHIHTHSPLSLSYFFLCYLQSQVQQIRSHSPALTPLIFDNEDEAWASLCELFEFLAQRHVYVLNLKGENLIWTGGTGEEEEGEGSERGSGERRRRPGPPRMWVIIDPGPISILSTVEEVRFKLWKCFHERWKPNPLQPPLPLRLTLSHTSPAESE
jgi:hypothetical protein